MHSHEHGLICIRSCLDDEHRLGLFVCVFPQ